MKKPISIIAILCVTILSAALLTSCGGGSSKVPATMQDGVLKVGIVNGGDRFASSMAGAPVGIEADIANRVANTGGYAIQFTMVDSSDALFAGMLNGEYDLGFGRITETDQRIGNLGISSGYGKGSLYLATPKRNYMNCLSSMQAGTLGVSIQAEAIKDEVEGIDTIVNQTYTDMSLLSADIASGNILAGLVSEREAVSMISDTVQAQELIDSPKENYVALVPSGSPLVDTVNEAIYGYRLEKAGVAQ